MPADGFLYVGSAETVLGTSDRFQVLSGRRGIYTLTSWNQAAARAAG